MKKYSIVLLPEFEQQCWIEAIREQYDPQWGKTAPYISLVFPFETDMKEEEISRIVEFSLYQFRHFNMDMKGVSRRGTGLHLDVGTGYEYICEMHSCLYSTILSRYKEEWRRRIPYTPHIMLGNLKSEREAELVRQDLQLPEEVLKTVIRYVYLEEIREDQSTTIVSEHKLRVL